MRTSFFLKLQDKKEREFQYSFLVVLLPCIFLYIKEIVLIHGFLFLFQGMAAPLVGVAPIFALSFWGNDFGKTLIRRFTGSQELGLTGLALAGGFSGIGTTIIMAPGERIKCILQVIIN